MAVPNPVPSLGAILRTRAYCTLREQTSINVRHWVVTAITGSGVTLNDMVKAMSDQFGPHYKALINADATYYGLDLAQLSPGPETIPATTTSSQGVGLVAGNEAPRQVAGVITLKTDQIGRAFRGRVYVPFPSQASIQADGNPNVAYGASLQQLANDYSQSVTIVGVGGTIGLNPALFHRKTTTVTTITHALIRAKFGTQRRRGSYGRPNPPPF